MSKQRTNRLRGQGRRRDAFTLVELLVVIGIIAVLAASVITGGSVLLTRARAKHTEATLTMVQHAIEQFQRDAPSIVNANQRDSSGALRRYRTRYGGYPPDELEVFTGLGLTGDDRGRTLAPGGAVVIPEPQTNPYPDMQFLPLQLS